MKVPITVEMGAIEQPCQLIGHGRQLQMGPFLPCCRDVLSDHHKAIRRSVRASQLQAHLRWICAGVP